MAATHRGAGHKPDQPDPQGRAITIRFGLRSNSLDVCGGIVEWSTSGEPRRMAVRAVPSMPARHNDAAEIGYATTVKQFQIRNASSRMLDGRADLRNAPATPTT